MWWRSIGERITVAFRSRQWWTMSTAAAVSSVNKRWHRQLKLLLPGVLLAGRGGEGQGTDGDWEFVAAGETRAAS
jgi:hypothetical protein